MKLLLGESGEIGSFLTKREPVDSLRVFNRSVIDAWISGGEKYIRRDLLKLISKSRNEMEIFYCIGNTNPNAEIHSLNTLNFLFPKSIAEAINGLPFRLITFGSVHENSNISNPYMDSKKKLLEFLLSRESNLRWNHFQLHTLYSELLPKPYMFLGQILESVFSKSKFKMSSGLQFRQFHHTADVVDSILSALPYIETNSVTQVSGQTSVGLAELASTIFSHLGQLQNLEIGSLPDPVHEIYSDQYLQAEFFRNRSFRNPVTEIPKIFSSEWLPKYRIR